MLSIRYQGSPNYTTNEEHISGGALLHSPAALSQGDPFDQVPVQFLFPSQACLGVIDPLSTAMSYVDGSLTPPFRVYPALQTIVPNNFTQSANLYLFVVATLLCEQIFTTVNYLKSNNQANMPDDSWELILL